MKNNIGPSLDEGLGVYSGIIIGELQNDNIHMQPGLAPKPETLNRKPTPSPPRSWRLSEP